jgi:hypothetical protein
MELQWETRSAATTVPESSAAFALWLPKAMSIMILPSIEVIRDFEFIFSKGIV